MVQNAKHQPRNAAAAAVRNAAAAVVRRKVEQSEKHQPRNVAVAERNVKLPKAEKNVVVKLIVVSQKR